MKFLWNRKDLTWLGAGFALEIGLWTYFLFAMAIQTVAIDIVVVVLFLGGLHFMFKLAVRRHERPRLLLFALILGVLGVLASELVGVVADVAMGGGELNYTFDRDAVEYLALFSAHFVPAALCAYGVRPPTPSQKAA